MMPIFDIKEITGTLLKIRKNRGYPDRKFDVYWKKGSRNLKLHFGHCKFMFRSVFHKLFTKKRNKTKPFFLKRKADFEK